MVEPTATATPTIPGWRTFRSDTGRLWASREDAFPDAAMKAGANRTVDADSEPELRRLVKEQEERAEGGSVA